MRGFDGRSRTKAVQTSRPDLVYKSHSEFLNGVPHDKTAIIPMRNRARHIAKAVSFCTRLASRLRKPALPCGRRRIRVTRWLEAESARQQPADTGATLGRLESQPPAKPTGRQLNPTTAAATPRTSTAQQYGGLARTNGQPTATDAPTVLLGTSVHPRPTA